MAQEYQSKKDGIFNTFRKENLDSQDFSLICELLDQNMDNQDIFIGRPELTDFV